MPPKSKAGSTSVTPGELTSGVAAPQFPFLLIHTFYATAANAERRNGPGKKIKLSVKNTKFARNSTWTDGTYSLTNRLVEPQKDPTLAFSDRTAFHQKIHSQF